MLKKLIKKSTGIWRKKKQNFCSSSLCLLTDYMDEYFSQGIEENVEKFDKATERNDLLMDVLILQRVFYSDSGLDNNILEKISNRVSQRLRSCFKGSGPETLNPSTGEEILHCKFGFNFFL